MNQNNTDYLSNLIEEIRNSEIDNNPITCLIVNSKDYNNHILPHVKNASNVNYESPYYGTIDPIRIHGIKIISSIHIQEGSFVKSTTDLTNQPFTKYQPTGFSNTLKEEK